MKNTKRHFKMVFSAVVLSMLWSCSATMYSSTGARFTDDLYATHDKQAIAKQVAAEREQARIAAVAAAEAEKRYLAESETGNPYQDILEDDYESAYARRLKGFESPSYRMPSSYQNFRYGSDAQYASAYDPSFYNVMVMGDQVWVEPKYVTSMFGNWGSPANVNFNFGFGSSWGSPYWGNSWGWNNPYYGWGQSHWNSPYYGYNPYWNYPYYGGGYPHWGGHYPHWGGHYPSWGGQYYDKNTSYRPSYSRYNNSGSGSSSGYRQPSKYSGSGTTNNGNRRPSTTSPTYRNRYDKTPSTNSRPESTRPATRPTYNPPSSNYPSGGGSSSGGSSSGGSSSGNSYGGSSGRSGGSRGR